MAGYRALTVADTTALDAAQSSYIEKGYLLANAAPYNLATGNTAAQNVTALQAAIDAGYANNLKVCITGDATYDINAALYLHQASVAANIGGQGGGGNSTRLFAHILQGILVNGNRPTIRLVDAAAPSSMTDLTLSGEVIDLDHYRAMFFYRWFDAAEPLKNNPTRQYAGVFRNINLVVGANPGVCGIYFSGAQAMLLSDCDINATGAKAGIWELSGSGSSQNNITITGGEYGVIQTDYRPTPQMANCHFVNQTIAGVVNFSARGGLTFRGCSWVATAAGYSAISMPATRPLANATTPANNVNGSFPAMNTHLMDCKVQMTGAAAAGSAIESFDGSVSIFNSYFDCATIAKSGQRSGAELVLAGSAGTWRKVKGYSTANLSQDHALWVNGVEDSAAGAANKSWLWEALVTATPPADWEALHSWTQAEIIHQFSATVIEVVPGLLNDRAGHADNHANINTALTNSVTVGHADFGKPVFLKRGFWFLHGTVEVPAGAKLVGAGQSQTVLMASHVWQPAVETAIVRTADDDESLTHIQDIGINVYEGKPGTSIGADLTSHKYFVPLHWRGRVKTFLLQVCRHEFYGAGGAIFYREAPLVRFSGKASGQYHAMSLDMVPDNRGSDAAG